jgi:acyl carrier protein
MSSIQIQVLNIAGSMVRRRDVRLEMRLIEDLGFDSLKVLELVTDIEDELGVRLDETSLRRVRTVRDLSALVEELTTLKECA